VKEAQASGKTVVDDLNSIRTVLDRRETRERLQHMQEATNGLVAWAEAVLVPSAGVTEADTMQQMQHALQQCDALICKPCVACGIPQSHDMRLVWDAASLPPSVRFHLRDMGSASLARLSFRGRCLIHCVCRFLCTTCNSLLQSSCTPPPYTCKNTWQRC
jgi:hypothetical protein